MRIVCFVVLSICAFGLGSASAARIQDTTERDSAVKEEFKRLEGTWQLVDAPKEYDVYLIFSGTKCSLRHVIGDKEKTREVEFKIDPTKSPKWVDSQGSDNRTWPGIYEVKEGTLRMVFQSETDGKRPTEFKKGDGQIMSTYKRVKL